MSHFAMSLTVSETVHYHFHLAYREISLPRFQYGMWFLFSPDNSGISDFIPSFIWNSFSEHEEHIIRNLITFQHSPFLLPAWPTKIYWLPFWSPTFLSTLSIPYCYCFVLLSLDYNSRIFTWMEASLKRLWFQDGPILLML